VIWSPIPKHIGSFARIGVRERKIGKEKESKKEKHGEGQKKQVEHGKRNQEEYGHGREKIT
jgi:hypothetical protein